MLKVGETHGQPLSDRPGSKKRVGGKEAAGAAGKATAGGVQRQEEARFKEAFLDASRQQEARALDALMADLDKAGERLAAAQNFQELDAYKGLVAEFLKRVSSGMARLQFSGGGEGRQAKVHVILKKVDSRLEALTAEVLRRQSTPLKILERLDEIRGLLLDLYK